MAPCFIGVFALQAPLRGEMDGSGEGVDSRQEGQVVLVRQGIHEPVGTTRIEGERGTLLSGQCINEVIRLLDLLPAEAGQLVVG